MKKALLENVRSLKEMNLNPDIIMEKKVFATTPFEKNGSHDFIDAVKNGDI